MKHITQFFKFFNLTDREGNLSITNILLIAAAIFLGMNPEDIIAVGVTGLAGLNYMHKRLSTTAIIKADTQLKIDQTFEKLEKEYNEKVTETLKKVADDVEAINSVKDELSSIKAQTKDVLDKVSKSELGKMFK